jgi:PAS domain S-box-containing protein
MGLLRDFFSSPDFMPHGYCYLWQPGLVWLHVLSDSLIALAYFSIPVALIYFIRKRRDLPFDWMFVCFGAFILACGATHAMEVWNVWHGAYWLAGIIKAVTAAVSLVTAVLLVRLIPQAMSLRSPEVLRLEIAERKRAEEALSRAKNDLELRVQERTTELSNTNDDLVGQILQRNLAEEELRRTEERFRLLIERVEDYAIFILDPTGRVASWNVGAQRIQGYSAQEMIGQHFSRFYPQDNGSRGKPEQALREAAAEGRFEEEGWRVRKDGSHFWANVVLTALRDPRGGLVGFSKITRDLTERKRIEEALRASEEQLRIAQKASGSGAWDWNPRTGVCVWSEDHSRIFGLPPESVAPTWESGFELVLPDDRPRLQATVLQALKPEGELEVEYRIQRRDGQVRWVMSKGRTYCGDEGRPIRMIGLTQDITDRKNLEQALQKTQSEIARLSRVLTMGELTSSIAHEVNQPLAAVVTNGDACLRWLTLDPPNICKARDSVVWIIKEGKRAAKVIKRIRAMAKNTPPQKAALGVNEVIEEVLGLVNSELSRNRVSLQTQLASQLPGVLGDRVQLQQVILNLISNGIEAMNAITQGPKELAISTNAVENDQVLITVRDSGTGLTPKLAERLFEAFFTTKNEGVGLGLSISRTIVEAHGGRLWAVANDDHGATFHFTLPRMAEAAV